MTELKDIAFIRGLKLALRSLPLLLFMISVIPFTSAQDKTRKIKPKLRVNYTNYLDSSHIIKANVYYMDDGDKILCEGMPVNFYTDEYGENLFQQEKVNEEGFAIIELSDQEISAFRQYPGHYYFYVETEGSDQFKPRDEELWITGSKIELEFNKSDSEQILTAKYLANLDSTDRMIPVESVPIKIFVQRALAPLAVGGDFNFTDENGEVEIDFPTDIPGDENGNITVMVKVEEHEEFGTVVYQKEINWGVPYVGEDPLAERSLIGDNENAPLFMVISINTVLLFMWGYLAYLIYRLVRIKKLGEVSE